jgi:hypothetical protein
MMRMSQAVENLLPGDSGFWAAASRRYSPPSPFCFSALPEGVLERPTVAFQDLVMKAGNQLGCAVIVKKNGEADN